MAKAIYVGVNEKIEFVDYIESTGTQYIDTGYYTNKNSEFVLDGYLASSGLLFGSGTDGQFVSACIMNHTNVYRARWRGNATSNVDMASTIPCDTTRHSFKVNRTSFYIDNVLVGNLNSTYDFTETRTTYIFGWNNGSGSNTLIPTNARIYSFKIYDNGTLVRDFKPCKYNSIYGLYDVANNKFYPNRGTGDFLGGEVTGEVLEFSKARKVKKLYAGIENIARKVKKGYIGVTGIARQFFGLEKKVSYYGTLEDFPQALVERYAASNDKYILFAGGKTSGTNTVSAACYAYNFDLIRTTATELSVARCFLSGTAIGDYILFAGGLKGSRSSSNSVTTVDAYDTNLVRTSLTGLSKGRFALGGTNNGEYALFAGGSNYSSYQNGVDAYDKNLVKSSATSLNTARLYVQGTNNENYAIFSGGYRGSAVDTVEAYNSSLVKSTPSVLSETKCYHMAASTGNYAIFAGGNSNESSSGTSRKSVDAYDNSLVKTSFELPEAKNRGGASSIAGNNVLFVGGRNGNTDSNTVEIYDSNLNRTMSSIPTANYEIIGGNVSKYAVFTGHYIKNVFGFVYD